MLHLLFVQTEAVAGQTRQKNRHRTGRQRNSRMEHTTLNEIAPLLDVRGAAALAICESLLLALNDRKILPEHEIMGVLHDAAAAHDNEPDRKDGQAELHKAVSVMINLIIDGGNSVRRS